MSTKDAIRRAQAWLIDAKGHDLDAVDALAALGPASVALAAATNKLMDALRTESDSDRILAEAELNGALEAWTEAVQSHD